MQIAESSSLPADSLHYAKPNKQFWTLQTGAWLGYCVVVFLAIIHPQFEQENFNFSGQLLNLGIETLSGFVLSCLQWFMLRKIVHLPLRLTLFFSFALAAILGCIFNVIKLASYKSIIHNQVWYQELDMLEFGGWLLFSVATMYVFTAIFFIMLYNNRLQTEHEMLLRAQTSAKEAQLEMLRYQLNPHFMFNTLNALSTLIYKQENDKANEMLDKLCSFFRYSLISMNDQESNLKEELELLELYLSIEKVRFESRLNVAFQIDDDARDAKVPSLFLQPIVENAIKFGVEGRKSPGNIVISVQKEKELLVIEVIDDGPENKLDISKGFGIGLKNTQERLNTMFNTKCHVSVNEEANTGTKVRISLPFVKSDAND
ncbi:histidine kinase [Glaciecola sp. MH2013]|uniref:sensor histidine kinase n=1 Tax=Glaciecola sp. MH2013 TaxID=2785524 RepID=UPI00189D290F|nr:histidine kinase [Glaciecola sp. MH2013]MBF7074244.1 histidine kinase [Glaciecola sp. MH2013]